ncbi:MAG: glycine--tRNA ligase beta subunit [Fimbriimonadales bacterium]|nr:MAG: glycine--tRNA ligase beta subunit [Fimbriimonadales bacterium]
MERATLLLEIGCEEIPAAFMRGALEQLQERLSALLSELRLEHGSLRTLGTPRRLIALVADVARQQTPQERIVRGPAKRACFDAQGNPTQALIGFARSRGVEPHQVQFQETPQGEYAFVQEYDPGQPAVQALAEALPKMILSMTFPKMLRWGHRKMRFARPIRWIVAMLGREVIPFELEGIPSGSHSRGHRFLAPEPFAVESPERFLEQLRAAHVIADPEERARIIVDGATRLAHSIGAHAVIEPDLLDENAFLVEQPHLLLGGFPETFLRLPAPVLISAMKKHEKFFPVVDAEGALLPRFISVYNNGDPDKVREGNEWVLVARFNDAAFFFEEDRKQPLEAFVPALGRILYQQKLGTLLDKVHRLETLTERLAHALDWDADMCALAQRAALLCKADLATQMVMEFPDLQGVIGAEYAHMSGEEARVVQAIREHYMPRHAGDPIPESALGRALAVLDRIDALVGYVGLGYMPKGSSDPFGLRRAAAGVVEILQHEPDYPTLAELVQRAHDVYREQRAPLKPLIAVQADLRTLFYSRMEALLEEQGVRYDLVRATLGAGWDDSVYGFMQRARLLQQHADTPEFVPLVQTATRPANILAAAEKKHLKPIASLDHVDAALFEHETERALYETLTQMTPRFEGLYYKHDYEAIYQALLALSPAVNALFDGVMVMTDDAPRRQNRLNLLACAHRLYLALADFTQVVQE